MTTAFSDPKASGFQPRSGADLRAIRAKLIERLHPRTVDELEFLRSIGRIDADDEEFLEKIIALNFVIGDTE